MSTQPRKPAGSPNSTGGQYDVNPSANVSLPALVPPPAANSVRRTLPARAPARVWSETGGVRQRNQASDPDPRIRFQLACNPYADRLVLADLAGDDNVRVRRAVAYNRAVSNKVLRRLLDDPDARVRSNAIEQAGMRDDLEESTIKRMLAEDRPRTVAVRPAIVVLAPAAGDHRRTAPSLAVAAWLQPGAVPVVERASDDAALM